MTPVELQRKGMELLVRELGYADAVAFMLQFSAGKGDYTRQRRKLFAGISVDDLLEATAVAPGGGRAKRRSRGRKSA